VKIEPSYAGGEGPPLVLLHGITATWPIWRPVLGALERRHAVYAPTLPGHHGGPALAAADRGLPAIADEVERMLDEQGLETAHLVGNSLGGWLALELARRGRAKTVVALSPGGAWRNARDRRRVVMLLESTGWLLGHHQRRVERLMLRPRLRRISMRTNMEHGERVPVDAAVSLLRSVNEATAFGPFMRWVRTASPETGAGIDVPVRIVWGKEDKVLPFRRYGAPMMAVLPHAELIELPGCGHVPMYDDPEGVAQAILDVSAA
jgi:pimeloyl-ACP methyl ester carboxylesterase